MAVTDWHHVKVAAPIGYEVSGQVVGHLPSGVFVDLGLGFLGQLELPEFSDLAVRSRGQECFPPLGAPITAWVNSEEIKSVVLNLVVNALDSMDEGGRLTIRLGQRGDMAELQFSDTGCGMTQEVLDNIFEPFYTRSRTGKGTGLGLTISHRIITQHGGEIEANSAGPNQGSTFIVRLPVNLPEAPPVLPGPGLSPGKRDEHAVSARAA